MAGDLNAGEIRSSEVLLLSVTLTSGVGGPLSAARGPRRVEIWVLLAFFTAILKWIYRKYFPENCLNSIKSIS